MTLKSWRRSGPTLPGAVAPRQSFGSEPAGRRDVVLDRRHRRPTSFPLRLLEWSSSRQKTIKRSSCLWSFQSWREVWHHPQRLLGEGSVALYRLVRLSDPLEIAGRRRDIQRHRPGGRWHDQRNSRSRKACGGNGSPLPHQASPEVGCRRRLEVGEVRARPPQRRKQLWSHPPVRHRSLDWRIGR